MVYGQRGHLTGLIVAHLENGPSIGLHHPGGVRENRPVGVEAVGPAIQRAPGIPPGDLGFEAANFIAWYVGWVRHY